MPTDDGPTCSMDYSNLSEPRKPTSRIGPKRKNSSQDSGGRKKTKADRKFEVIEQVEGMKIDVSANGRKARYSKVPPETPALSLMVDALRYTEAIGATQAVQRNYVLSEKQFGKECDEPLYQADKSVSELLGAKERYDGPWGERLLYILWTRGPEGFYDPVPGLSDKVERRLLGTITSKVKAEDEDKDESESESKAEDKDDIRSKPRAKLRAMPTRNRKV